MIINKAEFITSQAKYTKINELPEIAIVGRSNVGKSSLINILANRKKLARTSSEPGRTRLINYFKFNDEFMLVDLPGYGFAKGAKSEIKKWGDMIVEYLNGSKELVHVFVLLDIRHEPSENDKIMLDFLYKTMLPFTLVATKADKISNAQMNKALNIITSSLGVGRDNIIITSSESKLGSDKMLGKMETILRQNNEKEDKQE